MIKKHDKIIFDQWAEYHQEVQDEQEFTARTVERIREIKDCLNNMYVLRFNAVRERIEYRRITDSGEFKDLVDRDLNSMYISILELNIKTTIRELRTILESEFVAHYHPFRSFFEELPQWDGNDYIRELSLTVKTTNDDFWYKCLRKWLVALAACATIPEVTNHTCIVLNGAQGIGKTTWAARLLPERMRRYFYSGKINVDNKDSLMYLSECILINLDELEALNRKQMNSLKDLITKPSINYRRPYAHFSDTATPSASFIGSVNSTQFLTDTTGSRRWLCFEIEAIDNDRKVNLEQVFSQAFSLLNEGFRYWFDLDEIQIIQENNQKFQEVTLEEELLLKYFQPGEKMDENAEFLKTTEIASIIVDNENAKGPVMSNAFVQRVGRFLSRNRFIRIKSSGAWGYIVKRK